MLGAMLSSNYSLRKICAPPSASPCTSKKQKWHSYKHATAQPYLPETYRS